MTSLLERNHINAKESNTRSMPRITLWMISQLTIAAGYDMQLTMPSEPATAVRIAINHAKHIDLLALNKMRFKIQSYPFGQLYYPDRGERSTIRLFREELLVTRGLKEALEAVGYRRYNKILTRGQVQTIV